jgi:16S rRNA (cytidine1402-2'-O)-methyltransferase
MSEPQRVIRGSLLLIPVSLSDSAWDAQLPLGTREAARRLRFFVAEKPKSARAWLRSVDPDFPLHEATIQTLDEHTRTEAIANLLSPIETGHDLGLVSEAGCPAVADPGAALVAAAHRRGIRVIPLIGPSALLLALMASGLNGQRFTFHGYLPREKSARERALKELEKRSRANTETQMFIEAPYRNNAMLQSVLRACHPGTLLTVAADLTAANELIATRTVKEWRDMPLELDLRPTVFLLLGVT